METKEKKKLESYVGRIEEYLDSNLPSGKKEPKVLHEAMRYSVFSGGKRLRPLIVLAVGDMAGVRHGKLMPVACGLELLHNFSLVHDDLPAMDDDDYRRGKLTCHRKFGEPVAILAGDALLTLAFEMISETGKSSLVREIAKAVGPEGMAGGQVMDIIFQGREISNAMKKKINNLKTGRLFHACFEAPLFFKKVPEKEAASISLIAKGFGEAFQLRDDIEDNEGDIGYMSRKIDSLYLDMEKEISFFGRKGRLLGYIAGRLFGLRAKAAE